MTTVAIYFSINTESTEREADASISFIRSSFFRVTNLQGVGFADTSGKPIKVPDHTQLSADLAYFTFRSIVSAIIVDTCARDKLLSVDFSLRFPQIF